ncbi:MAG TPA: CRISPR-associated helicase Cas3' [Exilispira sp.]|nr:CRISPR-associated helicase Cas3' [Exilispira sp.]
MKKSYSFKLLSHPDRLLCDHLQNTANLSKEIINNIKINIDYIEKEVLSTSSFIIGLSHDIGKATYYFQQYITEKDEKRKSLLKNKPETHHGLLSALFTYYLLKKYLETNNIKINNLIDYLPIISFIIVRRHHGDLHNALDEVYLDEDQEKIIEEQLKKFDYNEIQEIFNLTLKEKIFSLNVKDIIDEVVNNYKSDIFKNKKIIRDLKNNHNLLLYFIFQLFYSILLDSDKTDAIFRENNIRKREYIDPNIIDVYKKNKFSQNNNKINNLRNEIYNEVIGKIKEISLNDKIYSLNVPTGTGKTLTSLSFAFKMREKIKSEKGYLPRIIYSLPFLSIIEQNYDLIEKLFKFSDPKTIDTSILLKHHHLSDISYKKGDNEYEIDESEFLIEGWNSEIIVTTFWQFFHTLFSNKNSMIRKFHNLSNSIIILDEIQSIPHNYWKLINESLSFLAEKFNSYIILLTATQPLIFCEKNIKELIINKEKYFKEIDRVDLSINLNEISLEEFKNIIKEDLLKNSNKDFLIVLNTIKSSIDVFKFIKSLNLKNTELYYLSTNIIPKERLFRINKIRNNNNDKFRKVIVSTQLIEAGVDIDVDVVYRDFATLDSINQVAGRCNRNNLKEMKGKVYVFIIKDRKQEINKYIYDPFLISKTKDIFKSITSEIKETNILNLNNMYFLEVRNGMSNDISDENLKYLYNVSFEDIGTSFKLIDEDYDKVDVFIEKDKNAIKIWNKFKEINEIKNRFERKKIFLKIKKDFYDYVISIRKDKTISLNNLSEISYVSMDNLKLYYDKDIGFKEDIETPSSICF